MFQVGLLPAAEMSTPEIKLGSWYIATPFQAPEVGAVMSRVPAPVGAWVYDAELLPENTTVRAEPLEVVSVYPLVSSCPFSMTRTAPDDALIVTFPVSCRSPQTITSLLKVFDPDHWLLAGSGGSFFWAGSCGYELHVLTGILDAKPE